MKTVSEERMTLRVQYSRETDEIFSDNIPKYSDWLETKLAALRQLPVGNSDCTFIGDKDSECWKVLGRCICCEHYKKNTK